MTKGPRPGKTYRKMGRKRKARKERYKDKKQWK